MLLTLLVALRRFVTVEQPASSVLEFQPCMQRVFGATKFYALRFSMWYFEGRTLKPSVLYSNHKFIEEILEMATDRHRRFEQPCESLVHRWKGRSTGAVKFRGNAALKDSQEYPQLFGHP